jgi:hypothetical protein
MPDQPLRFNMGCLAAYAPCGCMWYSVPKPVCCARWLTCAADRGRPCDVGVRSLVPGCGASASMPIWVMRLRTCRRPALCPRLSRWRLSWRAPMKGNSRCNAHERQICLAGVAWQVVHRGSAHAQEVRLLGDAQRMVWIDHLPALSNPALVSALF